MQFNRLLFQLANPCAALHGLFQQHLTGFRVNRARAMPATVVSSWILRRFPAMNGMLSEGGRRF